MTAFPGDRGPLARWVEQVSAEFGLDVDVTRATRLILELTKDVAHQVDRPAAPVTAYLLGLAVATETAGEATVGDVTVRGSATDATERAAARIRALLADWPADGGA